MSLPRKLLIQGYYFVKPFLPNRFRIYIRRQHVARLRNISGSTWSINEEAGRLPRGWRGWPERKQFALVLTHDVDRAQGQTKVHSLVEMEMHLGFRSSFNFVSEGYHVSEKLRGSLIEEGFEVGVHGLRHKGNLFRSERYFLKQVPKINHYLKEWGSVGFRTPSMFHNLELLHHLEIEYDASTFDTDPFEPQPEGVGTVFPLWVEDHSSGKGYVELPYTLPQDFTLFVLMQGKNIDIWKRKLDWIVDRGGMALLNTHPDYMNFGEANLRVYEYAAKYYEEFLMYIKDKYANRYWHVLPKELAKFWKQNHTNKETRSNIS